jgi:hypothetical protein
VVRAAARPRVRPGHSSRRIFSAAMNFAMHLERETDALFVGETTGGVPNHLGDAKFVQGPASRISCIIANVQ